MNTVWLKIVAVIVVVLVVIVVFSKIHKKSSESAAQPAPAQIEHPKTIADTWRNDDKRLRAEPNVVESNAAETNVSAPPDGGQRPVAEPRKFRELTEDEKAGADQLFELAIQHRKMGRLPGGIGYGKMVQYCREIIERYPGSDYAYKAKRMLADIPERERQRYGVTNDEINPDK